MDWHGKVQADGITLRCVGMREREADDTPLAAPPPTPAHGVELRFDAKTRTAVPFRPTPDSSGERLIGALAVRMSALWTKLTDDQRNGYQALIDTAAASELLYTAPPASSDPLVINHDPNPSGETPPIG